LTNPAGTTGTGSTTTGTTGTANTGTPSTQTGPGPGTTTQPGNIAGNSTRVGGGLYTNGTTLQGRVVRIGNLGQVIVQTTDGREITLSTGQGTRFIGDNRQDIRISDLTVGANIWANYEMQGDRYLASAINLGNPPASVTVAALPEGGMNLRGRITKIGANPPQFTITTSDGREYIFYIDSNREFVVRYEEHGEKRIANAVEAVTASQSSMSRR